MASHPHQQYPTEDGSDDQPQHSCGSHQLASLWVAESGGSASNDTTQAFSEQVTVQSAPFPGLRGERANPAPLINDSPRVPDRKPPPRQQPEPQDPSAAAAASYTRIIHPTQSTHRELPLERAVGPCPSAASGLVRQPYDVLFGRGKTHSSHPGNVRMQLLSDIHRDAYLQAGRDDKTHILRSIVSIIKSSGKYSGRFLKLRSDGVCWEEVSNEVACRKVGHAIRDGVGRKTERIDQKSLEEILPYLSDPFKHKALEMASLANLYKSLGAESTEMLIEVFAGSTPSPPTTDEGHDMEKGPPPG